jgi:glycosyltransferase involved in cell wall biosynthesis
MATSERAPRLSRPLRVLIACDHIDYDGALHGGGRQLIELVRALDGSDVQPTVCVLRRPSALGRALVAEGLPFAFLGDHPLSPATLATLVQTIRERDIDVLHLTDYGASTFGRVAGWITRRPTIVQVISHHSPHQRKGFPAYVELAYRALAPMTARALAISDSVKEFAVARMGFQAADVEVLPYPLPKHSWTTPTPAQVKAVRARYDIPNGSAIVGAVTRFYPSKGIEHLVRAFPAVLRHAPDARLMLIGQGPQEERLRARARELGIADRVIFAGFQREAHAFVAAFDVAVTPSIEEGFGLVALEAQALGVPVVASRVGGLPEIVLDGRTGLLVEPADASALAGAITRLLGDAELRRRMGEAAKREAQRFSLDAYVARLSAIYRELARPHRTNGRHA